MKIDSSYVGMESVRNYSSESMDATTTSISSARGLKMGFSLPDSKSGLQAETDDSLGKQLQNAMDDLKEKFEKMRASSSAVAYSAQESELRRKIQSCCLDYLLMLLFGKKVTDEDLKKQCSLGSDLGQSYQHSSGGGMQRMTVQTVHYFHESEETSFSTTGMVKTADGREISFGIDVSMTREFMEYSQTDIEVQLNLADPLVINLDGNVSSVSDQKFLFDIDGDGVEDKISKLIAGSGFLALDKNNDGIINDGSELFGASSGDGFLDLRKYDEDGNGWIDEGDSIFDRLKIWNFDENGESHLVSLKDSGVGALYTGGINTRFSLNNEDNATNAIIRKTGMFLFEDGRAGTMRQIDLNKSANDLSAAQSA